ncbi:kinase-like domain-containing protein, partial [Schizophyllum fasciatum]
MTVDNTSTEGNTSKSVRQPPQIHALPVPPNTAFDNIVDLEETALDEVTGIFSQLTPASLFYEQPNEIYFTLPSTLYHRFRWTAFPDLSQQHTEGRREQFVAVFLNDLRDHCRQWMTARNWPLPTTDRQWLPVVTARLEPDGTQTSMFGIILVQSGAAADWSTALCDVQIVKSADRMPEAVRNLSTTAAYVFASQDNCLYHVGLAFAGEEFTIVIHDRAGRAKFVRREIHKHALLIVRLMVALTLVDKTPLGRDPTITRRADGVRLLTVNEVEYEIVDRLFSSAHVRGRGTVCWRCRRSGRDEDYVIKSAWVDRRRTETEASILKRTEGVFGVPSLVDHEIVANADGSRISTHLFRDCLRLLGRQKELQDVEILELHRLVMQPYGIPLTDFRSKEELLSGMRDAVAAHWGLWDDRDILHCDISDNNVLLRGDEPEERLRHGLLIDFDCATHVRGSYKTAPSDHKAGTLPYMSHTALMHPEVPHSRAHDLESFLYVLMWICTSYN